MTKLYLWWCRILNLFYFYSQINQNFTCEWCLSLSNFVESTQWWVKFQINLRVWGPVHHLLISVVGSKEKNRIGDFMQNLCKFCDNVWWRQMILGLHILILSLNRKTKLVISCQTTVNHQHVAVWKVLEIF